MLSYPIHPLTGLHAIGFTSRGPIWPVMGGSEDAPEAAPTDSPVPDKPSAPDKGFPEGTPIAEMTSEQQAAYWKHQSRRHEDRARAYGELTPEQAKELKVRNQQLEDAQLTADQKAVKEATEKASAEARAAAEADLLPKLQMAQLKSAAATVLTDKDQLASFLGFADPAKFIGDDGEIDEEKVMGHLTAFYAGQQAPQYGSGLPRHQPWGQRGQQAPQKPGSAGAAEAAKRFGAKTTTT